MREINWPPINQDNRFPHLKTNIRLFNFWFCKNDPIIFQIGLFLHTIKEFVLKFKGFLIRFYGFNGFC